MSTKFYSGSYASQSAEVQAEITNPVVRGGFSTYGSFTYPELPVKGNLDMWIDASDVAGMTRSGDAVTALADKSGNGRAWTGTCTLSSSYQNGLPLVVLSSAQSLGYSAKSWAGTNCSVFVVQAWRQPKNHPVTGRVLNGRNANWLMGYFGNQHPSIYGGSSGPTGARDQTDSNLHMFSATFSSANVCSFWDDQVLIVNNASTYTGPNGISINVSTAFSEPTNNAFGELIIYSSVLSATDRLLVENYLRAKWATP